MLHRVDTRAHTPPPRDKQTSKNAPTQTTAWGLPEGKGYGGRYAGGKGGKYVGTEGDWTSGGEHNAIHRRCIVELYT